MAPNNSFLRKSLLLCVLCAATLSTTSAFAPASSNVMRSVHHNSRQQLEHVRTTSSSSSSSALNERRWNFNDGQGPFGMKKNAEVWNGRVAQVCFVIVFIQELVQGKGVIDGIAEGNPINLAMAGVTLLSFVGLTAFLAFKGTDDYVANELKQYGEELK